MNPIVAPQVIAIRLAAHRESVKSILEQQLAPLKQLALNARFQTCLKACCVSRHRSKVSAGHIIDIQMRMWPLPPLQNVCCSRVENPDEIISGQLGEDAISVRR